MAIAVAATISIGADTADASAWTRNPGRLFVSSKADYFVATSDAPPTGAADNERFERVNSDLYLEWGLARRFMVGGKFIYGDASYFDGTSTAPVGGFWEAEAFAQYEIFRTRRHAFSVKATAIRSAQIAEAAKPSLVSEGYDAEVRVLYGRDLLVRPFPVYAAVETGYRRRFGDAADQLRIDALVGAQPFKRLLLLIDVFSIMSIGNEDAGGADFSVLRVQPSAVWRVSNRYALQAGLTRDLYSHDLLPGGGYFLSLWTEF